MQDDHLRIADTLLEIPGVRYVVTTVYLREIWGWIVTQCIALALMVASAVKKDLKKVPWVLTLAKAQSTCRSAAHDKPALVVLTFEWLFQQALVSRHKSPTYRQLASCNSGNVYKAITAWGLNSKPCQLGEHNYFEFSKTKNAPTSNYDRVPWEILLLTLLKFDYILLFVCWHTPNC